MLTVTNYHANMFSTDQTESTPTTSSKPKPKSVPSMMSLSDPPPSRHTPHFGPLAPDTKTGLLPVAPADTENFADLYPERRDRRLTYGYWDSLVGNDREADAKRVCEHNVIRCMESMPMVRNIVGALESQGCKVDWERHLSCNICKPGNDRATCMGGYDERANQTFVCANNATDKGAVHAALVRNLIGMFDSCVAKVDHRNLDHLACTEVRKANLANCEFGVYWSRTDANFAIKDEHRSCVKNVAVEGLVKAKFVEREAALEAVDRVFNRCYGDLEPFGRRARAEEDIKMAHAERYLAGYK